ncbi:MAG: hypothetical protein RLZZ224_1352 [Verrucomicrobiota bacterium]|jgi:hypothetical protein
MKPLPFFIALLLASCSPFASSPAASAGTPGLPALSSSQKAAIGKKIWQNECAGSVDGLTTWNAGENFPSLGIGHFIWYPAGQPGPFTESWPAFVAFCHARQIKMPAIAESRHAPWRNAAEFRRDFRSARMQELRQWLVGHVELQTDFIIARSRATLPSLLAAAPVNDRTRVAANYHKVASTAQGQYALIDYVNFKGDGINPNERYQGKGWGLLQVLGGMKDVSSGPAAAQEFAASATRVLNRRIDLSPPARGEERWRAGWTNRCQTYARAL